MTEYNQKVETFYDQVASERDKWKKKNSFYYENLEHLCELIVPKNRKILEIGCGTGDLLSSLHPLYGVGIDISQKMLDVAKKKYPHLTFNKMSAENITLDGKFDYIILSDLIGNLFDVQNSFEELNKISTEESRLVITYYNNLWEPILILGEKLGLKMPQPLQNWLSQKDIENLLDHANWEVIKNDTTILLPIYIPILSKFVNRFLAKLPFLKDLCLVYYFVARKRPNIQSDKEYPVSVIIPARNEEGNIEPLVLRTPNLGSSTELIFVEGHSKDKTKEEIKRVIKKYEDKKNIILVDQGKGIGKGDAIRKGFKKAKGEIIMILDADLTVRPEDLPKFYQILQTRKAEYVQGSRLVYPMEKQAMRLLNIFGNKFFGFIFTWLLGQTIKDTLCGTKALYKKDYNHIAKNRKYFGDFDPFGDFDLIFGAAKLNLKMTEIPIRYYPRTYGETNISRFKHGWLLLKMAVFAANKLKFI